MNKIIIIWSLQNPSGVFWICSERIRHSKILRFVWVLRVIHERASVMQLAIAHNGYTPRLQHCQHLPIQAKVQCFAVSLTFHSFVQKHSMMRRRSASQQTGRILLPWNVAEQQEIKIASQREIPQNSENVIKFDFTRDRGTLAGTLDVTTISDLCEIIEPYQLSILFIDARRLLK